jgi:ATP/maltotriose-dependent transcriptional regulator MalT
MGIAAADIGDYARATACYAESLTLYRSLGNRYGEAYVLLNQGGTAICTGDLTEANSLLAQSRVLFEELSDRRCIAFLLVLQADVAREQHDDERALALYKESLILSHELELRPTLVVCIEKMACLAGIRGQDERAARLHGAAAALREAMHSTMPPTDRVGYERILAAVRKRMGDESFTAHEADGHALSLEETIAHALEVGS